MFIFLVYFLLQSLVFYRYKAAQEIDNQVKQMSGDIKEIVNNLNKANSKKDSDDDVSQIVKIKFSLEVNLISIRQKLYVLKNKIYFSQFW